MADDKDGREKQAGTRDDDDRQRRRDIATELERGDEPEPEIDAADLGDVEAELESLEFPATGSGDHRGDRRPRYRTVGRTIHRRAAGPRDGQGAVRLAGSRPRSDTATHGRHGHEADRGGQRDAAERGARWIATRRLREDLRRTRARVSPDDYDESIGVVRDWVVDRIRDKEKLPTSRQIRRQAAKVCRESGHEIRNDDWLGI